MWVDFDDLGHTCIGNGARTTHGHARESLALKRNTDYTFKALVFDVIVADAHRGKGLGEHLLKLVLEHPDLARVRHFELYCLPDVGPFYERHGFSTEVGGVRLMRRDGA